LPITCVRRDLYAGKLDFSGAQGHRLRAIAAARNAIRLRVDDKEAEAVLVALVSRDARGDDDEVGLIAVQDTTLFAPSSV
jgi:hypothetical protein